MNKKSKSIIYLAVIALLLALGVSVAIAAPAPKVDVCHLTDTGSYNLINISENAFQTHVDHGDAGPGELVPGIPGKKFAEDCSLVDANANVAGVWSGNSGLVGNLAYPFTMDLSQQPDGAVSGTISYTTGQAGTITGYVSGNDFYFTRNDPNGYWATCWPCVVSAGGDYFHGYGSGKPSQSVEWIASQ